MRIDGRHVMVTGGAGFIGSNLVEALLERGCKVRAVDDLTVGARENVPAEAELIEADIRDREAMTKAMQGIEVVMNLAVSNLRVSLYDPWPSHDVNAGGTLVLLQTAAAAGTVERFLYCSSSEAYGSAVRAPMAEDHPTLPTTVYGASKLAGEHYSLAARVTDGLATVVARPFNTYGYRAHWEGDSGEVIPKMVLRALNGTPPVIFGNGGQRRDFTFVTDTVRGLILAAEADELVGDVVNIAYGREVSIRTIAELVCRACGSDLEPHMAPPRPADVERHFADVTKAERVLGFRAEVAIEDGIGRYVEWFRSQGYDFAEMLARERARNWEPRL
jgi:UDP-glucose 4-epimerase